LDLKNPGVAKGINRGTACSRRSKPIIRIDSARGVAKELDTPKLPLALSLCQRRFSATGKLGLYEEVRLQIGYMREDWRDDSRTDANMIAVLAVLSTYAGPDGVCWPSQSTLAAKLKRSRPWVNSVIAALCDLGILVKIRRYYAKGGERPCLYQLTGHDEIFADSEVTDGVSPGDTTTPNTFTSDSHSRMEPKVAEAPKGWLPDSDDLAFLKKHRPELSDRQVAQMTRVFVATAQVCGPPGRAWRAWIMRERVWRPAVRQANTKPQPQGNLTERNAAAAQTALDRIMARRGISSAT
jgi:hypothetical protein